MHKFKELLEQEYSWPASYLFKFIFESKYLDLFKSTVSVEIASSRHTQNGKYISVTAYKMIHHTEEVLAVYEQARTIQGIISL